MLIGNGKRFYPETAEPKALGFAYHAENTSNAMKRYGAVFLGAEDSRKPEIILHQAPAHTIERIEGVPNILYTAYECPDIPPEYIEKASQMDMIICVSDFVTRAFRRAIGRHIPIHTCHLGVNCNLFSYIKRNKGRNEYPFTFLWVGAPNKRKGWDLIKEAWKKGGFFDRKDCVLYIKSSGNNSIDSQGNVIFDTRKISKGELASIYHAAHCFLFPSYGEGFGLTLAEAMATGLPCVYTPWGGVKDFIDKKTGYYLRYKIVPVNYTIPSTAAEADVDDIIWKMKEVMNNYSAAIQKGKNASRRINENFTWDHTGKNMMSLLTNFLKYRRQ